MNCYRTKSNLFSLWVLILIFISGCGSEPPTYSFNMFDRTGSCEDDNTLILYKWGTASFLAGKGGGVGIFRNPWPTKLVLSYKDHQGQPKKDNNGDSLSDVTVALSKMDSEKWAKVEEVFILFLPNDKILVEAFTRHEIRETDKVQKFLSQGQPTYSIGIKNNTTNDITKTSLKFGDYCLHKEQLAPLHAPHEWNPTGWKILESFPFPITDTADLQWTTSDGVIHKQEIQMKGNLPKDLNNQTLCFIIEPDNTVKFQVRPIDQYDTWSQEGRVWTKP